MKRKEQPVTDTEDKLLRKMSNLIIDRILDDQMNEKLKFQDQTSNIQDNDN